MRTTKAALGAAFLSAALLIAGCGQSGSQSGTDSAAGGAAAETGNGIAEKSPEEIIAAAGSAFRSAESVRVKIDVTYEGKPVKGDLKLTKSGDTSGWIEAEGLRINLIMTDGTVYLRSPELWEREAPEAAEFIGNRWVKVPPSDVKDMSPFTEEFTIKSLAKLFEELDPPTFVRKSEETVGAQPVVRLKGGDGFLDVMAIGEPYPVQIQGSAIDENEDGSIQFSDYGADFKIKAPANPLDPSKMGA